MKKLDQNCAVPPECCVVIEMEHGAKMGFRKAVLLQEIEALHTLDKAAKVSRISLSHARYLIDEMNTSFSTPLVDLVSGETPQDEAVLTEKGRSIVASYWKQFERIWNDIIDERSRYY